jgi:hypothetical protein
MNNVPLRIVTVSFVIFFLTFLGMRLSFLDKSSKPKSRPRAVLNLGAKSASNTISSAKLNLLPVFDIPHDSPQHPVPAYILSTICVTYFSNTAVTHHLRPLAGRSPPIC